MVDMERESVQNGKIRKTGWTRRSGKKGGGGDAISQLGRDRGRSRRMAALMIGISRVAAAMHYRGLHP
ncbi:MAG: hypothetical protein R3239_04585 [Thermodesulfobacteriota bacterium]|nr:hypothetical protein [Thermodesulfobacteriota bacterium]